MHIPPYVNLVIESGVAGYFVKTTFDSAVAALPVPSKTSGFYSWLYAFLRSEEAAIDQFSASRFPTTKASPAADAAKEGK